MKPLTALISQPDPEPAVAESLPLPPEEEVLVYIEVPADPAGTVIAFSSADDMDFDIVSTRR